MKATLSILGLWNWDETLFDNMVLPDGVDLDTVRDNIIYRLGNLECLYPSAPFMKTMIALWSKTELPTWQRLYNAMQAEYNPIENYDRYEEWEDSKTNTSTASDTMSGTEKNTGTTQESKSGNASVTGQEKDTGTNKRIVDSTETESGNGSIKVVGTEKQTGTVTQDVDGTVTENTTTNTTHTNEKNHYVSGYNSNTLVQDTKETDTGTDSTTDGTTTNTDTTTTDTHNTQRTQDNTTTQSLTNTKDTDNTTTDTINNTKDTTSTTTATETTTDTINTQRQNDSEIQRTGTGNEEATHSGHVHGNIGVMSAQNMLTQELELVPKLNIVNHIVSSFKMRFCILVY